MVNLTLKTKKLTALTYSLFSQEMVSDFMHYYTNTVDITIIVLYLLCKTVNFIKLNI